ncbi:MAG: carboxy terminal-processing peptidase [Bacteroidales bacterium]|nr:carboxy terminal-processing peptidase [Bacteroidales bacterium]
MKIRSVQWLIIPVVLALLSIIVLAHRGNIKEERKEILAKVSLFAINSGHYNPGNIDDSFSGKAFNLYMERLDYGKKFLLAGDVEAMRPYENQMDDAFRTADFSFFDLTSSLIRDRIGEVEEYFTEILGKPFDYNRQETFEIDPEKTDWAVDREELRERWRQSLKYETISRIYDKLQEQEQAAEKSDTVTVLTFAEIEAKSREELLKRYEDWFHRLSKQNDDDWLNLYMNSLLNVFDPHTVYFPPKDKENFDIRFSGQLEGIGAQLIQKNAYIEVSRIVPGSPSWKQGELEVGDFILKVAQGDAEPVDVVDMRLDDAVQLIRGPKGTEVSLTIKKLDGTIREISIIRDVVILEETYARSTIIGMPGQSLSIGYIKLPSFYEDFENKQGRSCYTDVRNELEKLRKEGIDGLIFDLRDNGGGSLEDVVKIVGLFIEQGPVVQVRGKGGFNRILADTDPSIIYKGPLVVMVNAVSASASEIFAAAIQDYRRGIIIGGTKTFGKGTVQNFSDLDRMVNNKPEGMDDLGSLKLTVQKFYRINGGATQLNGVSPDMVIPDYYNYIDYGERDLDYAMEWDEIASLNFSPWNPPYDLEFILKISETRISGDTLFELIDENGRRLKHIRNETQVPLEYDAYDHLMTTREQESKRMDRIGKDSLGLQIRPLAADLPEINADTSRRARIDAWLGTLHKDIYLKEAFHIMRDVNESLMKNARKEDQ